MLCGVRIAYLRSGTRPRHDPLWMKTFRAGQFLAGIPEHHGTADALSVSVH